ncbi:MAG: efflux transporter periplasmic adaptor subunit, partial [Ramlibacter sp.]|nr:efflux transporter periplasmic adaptor subunit [Ramlibacter sp.]
MDPQPPQDPRAPHQETEPAQRRISRRAAFIGTLIALFVMGGLGWLAWELTHPEQPAVAEGGRPGAAARPGGGAGGAG